MMGEKSVLGESHRIRVLSGFSSGKGVGEDIEKC